MSAPWRNDSAVIPKPYSRIPDLVCVMTCALACGSADVTVGIPAAARPARLGTYRRPVAGDAPRFVAANRRPWFRANAAKSSLCIPSIPGALAWPSPSPRGRMFAARAPSHLATCKAAARSDARPRSPERVHLSAVLRLLLVHPCSSLHPLPRATTASVTLPFTHSSLRRASGVAQGRGISTTFSVASVRLP